MSISMSPSAHYVLPTIWKAARRLGPLTDRRIEQLMKEGYYGDEYKDRPKKKVKRAKLELLLSARQKANTKLKNLLK